VAVNDAESRRVAKNRYDRQTMRRWWVLVAVLSVACGSAGSPPESPGAGSGGPVSITGRERIGWDQAAADLAYLGILQYAIYVDNERGELADVACGSASGASGYSCSGRLPSMSIGAHTLELVSFLIDGLESARSPQIRVSVTGSTAEQSAAGWSADVPESLAEGVALRIEKLASGLERPVDAVFLPDGRLLIAESAGRVRIFADGTLSPDALPQAVANKPDVLLSIAIDPAFARTRQIYILELAQTPRTTMLEIARYTELKGQLGQRAVVFQTPVTGDVATADLRFGPDNNLYVAVDGETGTGQLLRVTPSGTTPRDAAGAMPAVAGGIVRLRGMAWAPTNFLWIAAEQSDGASMNAVVMSAPPVRARVVTRQAVPGHLGPVAVYNGDAFAVMRGDALIASPVGSILRVHFDPGDPLRVQRVDRLLENRVGPVQLVSVGPDGAIYFCTADTLGRLAPLASR
jgi:glucose/arabinose dehydrogenase